MLSINTTLQQRNIDSLVSQLWAHGFTPISRKYGTYLPEPPKIGGYEVDVIAKNSRDHAIAVFIHDREVRDSAVLNKITFLAGRKLKYSNKKLLLFVGVSTVSFPLMKELIGSLDNEVKKQIRLIVINEPIVNDLFASEGLSRLNIV